MSFNSEPRRANVHADSHNPTSPTFTGPAVKTPGGSGCDCGQGYDVPPSGGSSSTGTKSSSAGTKSSSTTSTKK